MRKNKYMSNKKGNKKENKKGLLLLAGLVAAGYFLKNKNKTKNNQESSKDTPTKDIKKSDEKKYHTVESPNYRGDSTKPYDSFYSYDDDPELKNLFDTDLQTNSTNEGIRIRVTDFISFAYPLSWTGVYRYKKQMKTGDVFSPCIIPDISKIEFFNPFGRNVTINKIEIENIEIDGATYKPRFVIDKPIVSYFHPKFKNMGIFTKMGVNDNYMPLSNKILTLDCSEKVNPGDGLITSSSLHYSYGNICAYNYYENVISKWKGLIPIKLNPKESNTASFSSYFKQLTSYSSPFNVLGIHVNKKSKYPNYLFFQKNGEEQYLTEKEANDVIKSRFGKPLNYIKIKCWITYFDGDIPQLKNIIIKRKGAEGVTANNGEWISEFDDKKMTPYIF